MTRTRLGWCRWTLVLFACLAAAVAVLYLTPPPRHPDSATSNPQVMEAVRAITTPTGTPTGGVAASRRPSIPLGSSLADKVEVDGYVIEVWETPVQWAQGHSMVQVRDSNGIVWATDWVSRLVPMPAQDITGEGDPDVVVERYSGGANCCLSYVVLTLGAELTRIDLPLGTPCEATFRDLDGDGIFEVIACDDVLHCRFCSCASSPLPTVVLRYDPEQGYIPASPQFPEIYDPDIPGYRARAESRPGEAFEEQDPTGRCLVLPLVLAYLYSGCASEAWAALARYYPFPDAEAFRAEIEEAVSKSPLFVAAPDGGELGADIREPLVASDAAAEESGRKRIFSIAVDLNGDGAEETVVGIGARNADKLAEFIAPGEVYVYANPEAVSPVFACWSSVPEDLQIYFFQASLVGAGDFDGDGLTEVALVWLAKRSWPLAYRPLAILQYDTLTGTYELVIDVKRSVGEIGDYALADVDDDGRAEILEIDPVYDLVIDSTYGAEVYECHFCPHRYQVEVFEFTGSAFVADVKVNGGKPFMTAEKHAPYLGDGPVSSFLPELITDARSLALLP